MKRALVVLFLSIIVLAAKAQKEVDDDTPWTLKDRAYVGLGIGGLSFGSHEYYGQYFSIGVGAVAGYMLTHNLSAGAGIDYQYTTYIDQSLDNHVYGWYPFVRYNLRNFFLQFDYSMYNIKSSFPTYTEEHKADRFFGGIGFFSQSRGRAVINFLVSYDFLYTNSSMFGSPLHTRLFVTF